MAKKNSPDIMLHVFGFIIAGQINRKKRKPLKRKRRKRKNH